MSDAFDTSAPCDPSDGRLGDAFSETDPASDRCVSLALLSLLGFAKALSSWRNSLDLVLRIDELGLHYVFKLIIVN